MWGFFKGYTVTSALVLPLSIYCAPSFSW